MAISLKKYYHTTTKRKKEEEKTKQKQFCLNLTTIWNFGYLYFNFIKKMNTC